MNLKVNDNKIERITSQTVNGLNISALLESDAANTAVPETDYQTDTGFDPSQINIQVDLKRNGTIHSLINANLALLAVEACALKGGHLWFKGLPVQAPAVGKTHIVKRSIFLYFKGHYNIKDTDELVVNVTVNRATFGTGINANTSVIQVEVNESIGIEYQINRFNVHSITAELSQDRLTLGDNVTDILLHSFEKDWQKSIFRSVSLQSDRLDWTANEQELDVRHWDKFSDELTDILLSATANDKHPLRFPNSFKIHQKDEIDKAVLSFIMNPANVKATRNYVLFWSFETSTQIVAKAYEMKQKHDKENIEKVPLSIS